ncbi:hypothetical protein, partial [Ruminococcus flavefaciens]|uniref:hypothetical protein n=1 Tax=Ruminococcus flavefaciens TaxID=1265 RepID=UPI000563F459
MRNSKKKNNTFKRVAAGALSMALVAGALPANVGGFLTGGKGIVAHAETAYTAAETHVGLKLNVGDSFVIPESTHVKGYENMILWDGSTYDIGTQARTITVVRGENGALKLDGVEQNFTYPELESSTDQLCIIEYDNNSGWHLCGLVRCNAFTGVTSFDEINLYGDTIDGCDVTKVENHMSRNCNVTISNIESGKKVRLTYSDNTTNDIEPTEGTVTFTSALTTHYADESNKKVNSVEIVPIPTDLTLTAPNLTYTSSAQNLIADAPQGTKFSLTAPVYSFNHDAAWAEQLMLEEYYNSMEEAADSATDTSTQTNLINAARTLDRYRQAINHLYAGNPEDANSSIAAANASISEVNTDFSTENNDINAILDYINTYIRGKNLDDLKERFNTAADTSSWSTDVPQKTDAGTYTVYYQGDGVNYNKEIKKVDVIIAKANLSVGTDYTAPTGSDDLKYTAADIPLLEDGNTGSVTTVDSNTGEPVGTMEYGIAGTKEANIIKNTESEELTVGTVSVGDIYSPVGNKGINIPKSAYSKYILDDKEYTSLASWTYLKYNGSRYYMTAQYEDPGLKDGCDAVRVKEIRSDAIVFESYNSALETIDWKTTVPTAKDVGEYKVYYRVKGDANHNDTAPAFVTSAIEYATASLTLSPSLTGAVIVENGATEALEATDGVYTLAGTKKYNIYTNKSIADSTAATALDLTSKSSNKTFGGNTYSYRYEIEVPTTPAEGGYILSHTNNYVGKVSTEVGKANVMNIQEDGVTTENVAVLNADGVIYYGDQLEKDELVTIADGYGSIVNVDEIYLENNTASGGKVTGDALVIGTTYLLTAKVSVDADGDPDNGISGNTIYLKQQVTYAARPMTMNEYALKTEDGLVPLEVSDGTVNVPAEYWVCTLKDDSSKTYIRVEEPDEALSALFTWEKKSTFVYNSAAQKPVIVVKNGGDNTIVLADTAVAANETATPPVAAVAKDYNNAVAEKTDAGSYNYNLTAEANGNYAGSVTVSWSIAQADVSDYITVAPKNNVDTDGNKETLEAVVYDGAVLDGTDFEVKTNEAYAALAADSPVKKLVDEFIDQLKAKEAVAADPANNIEAQPAVPVKTFVNVSSGRYGVTTDITYDSEISSSGVSINANSVGSYSNVILKGNLTFECSGGDFTEVKITCGEYVKSGSNSIQLTLDGNDIKCGDDTILTKNDNEWFKIVSITHGYGNETNEYTINLTKVPKTETRYETYDIKNAGAHKANVTVSNSNFKTVEFKQKIDNSGKPVEDEDNSVAVTIAKRDVTLTPDEDLSMTYRDTEMPDLTYTIEDAKADGLTGVVAADKALFQKTTGEGSDAVTTNTGAIYVDKLVQEDAQAVPVQFVYATDENNDIDYTTAGLNNAGSYTYAVSEDDKFANYNIVLPIDIAADEAQGIEEYTAPTFTVDPLNLKNIENLNIVLNGKTNGWTTDGNSGSYIYDGSTKQVEVSEVFKPNEDVTETIDTIVNNDQKTAKQFTTEDESQISFDITYPIDENSHYIFVGKYDETYKGYSLKITPPTGKAVKTIKFYTPNNEQPGTIYVNGEANAMVDFKTVYEAAGGNLETTGLKISKLEITYSSTDYTLNADTDYTVGGATKRASAGTHNVQIMGKGNYTGVTTAPWDITEAEAGESTLLIDNTPSNEYNGKSYDGKAVTANVSFGDGASAYYVADAETDIKYYENNNVLESAPVDAGTYKVVATITCDGYATKTIEKTFNISPAVITVDSNAKTKAITYGDKLPAVTQADIDAIVGLTDDDKAYFQKLFTDGKLGLGYVKKYNANAQLVDDTSKLTFTLNGTLTQEEVGIIQQFSNNYNTSNFYWNVITNAKSIKDSSIKVEFTEGDTAIINPDGTFASDSAIKVYDTAILDQDGKATELVELGENNAATADYELTVESTATEGVYTLEIVGKNNYRGVRKIEFKAITAAKAATTFDIDFVETYVSNNKNRIRFNAAASVKSG